MKGLRQREKYLIFAVLIDVTGLENRFAERLLICKTNSKLSKLIFSANNVTEIGKRS